MFDSLAEGSVPARDPLRTSIEWLKRVFPKLPASIARRLVSDASASELAQLNSGKGPERLMQSARTLQREAQLSSAYRGLYMDSLVTADTETLALNTLETLPGWKDDLRIEVRNDHFNGELRASFGPWRQAIAKYWYASEMGNTWLRMNRARRCMAPMTCIAACSMPCRTGIGSR